MRAGPLISLALSILIGVLAVVFGGNWFNSDADAVPVEVKPTQAVVAEIETQTILVADTILARGDVLSFDAFREENWPAASVPDGALTDINAIVSKEGDWPRAVGGMVPGEPFFADKLTYQDVRDTLAAIIEPGYRAVSINVNDASGVAGFVLPDHRVDVNLFEVYPHPQTGRDIQTAKTILEDIRVLAVDQLFENDAEGTAVARTVTLQVLPEQARALGVAVDKGRLGLALRPKGEESLPAKRSPIVVPKPRPSVAVTQPKPKKQYADIRVIQGEEEETVRAPAVLPVDLTGEDK